MVSTKQNPVNNSRLKLIKTYLIFVATLFACIFLGIHKCQALGGTRSVILPQKTDGELTKLEYTVDGVAKGSTAGTSSITLFEGSKFYFALQFEEAGHTKLLAKDVKIASSCDASLSLLVVTGTDDSGKLITRPVGDDEIINPAQTYISETRTVANSEILTLQGITYDTYTAHIKAHELNENITNAINITYTDTNGSPAKAEFNESDNTLVINNIPFNSNLNFHIEKTAAFSESSISWYHLCFVFGSSWHIESSYWSDDGNFSFSKISEDIYLSVPGLKRNNYTVKFLRCPSYPDNPSLGDPMLQADFLYRSSKSESVSTPPPMEGDDTVGVITVAHGDYCEFTYQNSSPATIPRTVTANGVVLNFNLVAYRLDNISQDTEIQLNYEERSKYEISLPQVSDGVIITDIDGNTDFANNALSDSNFTFKTSPAEAYAQSFSSARIYAVPQSKLSNGDYNPEVNSEEAASYLLAPNFDGVYTIQSVKEPMAIIVKGTQINTYNITIPKKIIKPDSTTMATVTVTPEEYLTVVSQNDISTIYTAPYGAVIKASLMAAEGYNIDSAQVQAQNSSTETPSAKVSQNGSEYTISERSANTDIIISGVKSNSYNVIFNGVGAECRSESGTAFTNNVASVEYGGILKFKISPISIAYLPDGETLSVTTSGENGTLSGPDYNGIYTLTGVTNDTAVNITGFKILNSENEILCWRAAKALHLVTFPPNADVTFDATRSKEISVDKYAIITSTSTDPDSYDVARYPEGPDYWAANLKFGKGINPEHYVPYGLYYRNVWNTYQNIFDPSFGNLAWLFRDFFIGDWTQSNDVFPTMYGCKYSPPTASASSSVTLCGTLFPYNYTQAAGFTFNSGQNNFINIFTTNNPVTIPIPGTETAHFVYHSTDDAYLFLVDENYKNNYKTLFTPKIKFIANWNQTELHKATATSTPTMANYLNPPYRGAAPSYDYYYTLGDEDWGLPLVLPGGEELPGRAARFFIPLCPTSNNQVYDASVSIEQPEGDAILDTYYNTVNGYKGLYLYVHDIHTDNITIKIDRKKLIPSKVILEGTGTNFFEPQYNNGQYIRGNQITAGINGEGRAGGDNPETKDKNEGVTCSFMDFAEDGYQASSTGMVVTAHDSQGVATFNPKFTLEDSNIEESPGVTEAVFTAYDRTFNSSVIFKITQKSITKANSDGTSTTVRTYEVSDAQDDISIRMDREMIKHELTFTGGDIGTFNVLTPSYDPDSGMGFNNEKTKFTTVYGSTVQFTTSIKLGYNPSSVVITANGEPLKLINGTYTLSNITEDIQIKIESAAKNKVKVSLNPYDGITYKNASGEILQDQNELEYGGTFTFKPVKGIGYSESNLTIIKKTVSSGDETEIEPDEKGYYTLTDITENMRVFINGLNRNAYPVHLKESEGINYYDQYGTDQLTSTESLTQSALYGDSISFMVRAKEGYDISDLKVYLSRSASGGGQTQLNAVNNIYTVDNITSECFITTSAVNKTKYNVEFRSTSGAAFVDDYGATLTTESVSHGNSYSFKVSLDSAYNKSNTAVTLKGSTEPITPDSDGVYTIFNIKENKIVEIINIKKNTYNVTFKPTEGVEYRTSKNKPFTGMQEIDYGGSLSFRISLLDAYDASLPVVKLSTGKTLSEIGGFYTIPAVSSDVDITVEDVLKNPEEVTMADVNNVPSEVNSYEDISSVIKATKTYNSLSDEEKSLVINISDLKNAQEAAGILNHKSGNVSVSGIDWNLRLSVTDLSGDAEKMNNFSQKVDRRTMLSLYEIKLVDILTGKNYEVPYGTTVDVTIPSTDLTDYKNAVVVHEKTTGSMEYLDINIVDGEAKFSTSSFSLFGIAAKKIPNYAQNPSATKIAVSELAESEDELRGLLGEGLVSKLGNLIDTESSDGADSGNTGNPDGLISGTIEKQKANLSKVYTWAIDNEFLSIIIVLIIGSVIIWLIIRANKKQNENQQ